MSEELKPCPACGSVVPVLRWLNEPPAEPGYYWYEENGEKHLVCVFMKEDLCGEVFLFAQYWGAYTVNRIIFMPGKWAGPIPEPEK